VSTPRRRAAPAVTAVRGSARARLERLAGAWAPILQTGAAAAAAWAAATLGFGHAQPFFAPISAVISLGVARGQPRRRAVELVAGVAVGIAVADVISRLIGTGVLQIGLVVALALAAALLLGAGTILVNQAAVSAILVMTLPGAVQGAVPERFVDALIGGAVGLLVGQVLFPRNPIVQVARAAGKVLEDVAAGLERTAAGLAAGDVGRAEQALLGLRSLDDRLTAFYDAVAVARETAWLSPPHRRARGQLRVYADAAAQVDLALRNSRVLARAAIGAVRRGGAGDPALVEAIRTLARAVRQLGGDLAQPEPSGETRRLALAAAASATGVLERHRDLPTSMLVGQVRATATDLLRSVGVERDAAREAVDAAEAPATLPSRPG
jgi:uncharacterized membrane protein YgaE (UPF0421/DUF939 family)